MKPSLEDRYQWIADWAADLYAEYLQDDDKKAIADVDIAGMKDPDHYDEVERALADLDDMDPTELPDSGLLVRLYRLARVHNNARKDRLKEMAEEAAKKDWDDLNDDSDSANDMELAA